MGVGGGLSASLEPDDEACFPNLRNIGYTVTSPKDYRYNSRGRRDPFVNPVPKPIEKAPPQSASSSGTGTVRPQGLRGVLVNEATIAGVVTSKDPSMTLVIIGAPGGNRYFARVGDALYDAIVREITIDSVKFALTAPGGGREKATREIVRPVRPTSGENK